MLQMGINSCCDSAEHAFSAVQALPYTTQSLACLNLPWHHWVTTAEDMGVLQLMGMMWSLFNHLLTVFLPVIEDLWLSRLSGRANVHWLAWIHITSYHIMPMMLVFGLCPSTLSVYLRDCKACLLLAFKATPAKQIRWLSGTEMGHCTGMIQCRQQELKGVFGLVN
jgi:hypothetical protein